MIDNQFQELFRLVTTAAVTSINNIKSDVKELNVKVGGLEQKVDSLQTEFHGFRDETRENFQKLERKLEKDIKSLNKRNAEREKN